MLPIRNKVVGIAGSLPSMSAYPKPSRQTTGLLELPMLTVTASPGIRSRAAIVCTIRRALSIAAGGATGRAFVSERWLHDEIDNTLRTSGIVQCLFRAFMIEFPIGTNGNGDNVIVDQEGVHPYGTNGERGGADCSNLTGVSDLGRSNVSRISCALVATMGTTNAPAHPGRKWNSAVYRVGGGTEYVLTRCTCTKTVRSRRGVIRSRPRIRYSRRLRAGEQLCHWSRFRSVTHACRPPGLPHSIQ